MVDAVGLETDFTLETNRKRVKEKLLKTTLKTRISPFGPWVPDFNEQWNWGKTCILHSPSILKHILGVQDHSETLKKA